jgi:hypothetical protein
LGQEEQQLRPFPLSRPVVSNRTVCQRPALKQHDLRWRNFPARALLKTIHRQDLFKVGGWVVKDTKTNRKLISCQNRSIDAMLHSTHTRGNCVALSITTLATRHLVEESNIYFWVEDHACS